MFKKLPTKIFQNKKGELFIDGISYKNIVERVKTPVFVIIENRIRENVTRLARALTSATNNFEIFYSYKANSIPYVCNVIAEMNIGAEVVSSLELDLAFKFLESGDRIIVSSPVMNSSFLEYAINKKIKLMLADSVQDLEAINNIARERNETVRVAIRMAYLKNDHFGFIPLNDYIFSLFSEVYEHLENIEIKAIHIHTGTQAHMLIDNFRKRALITTRTLEILEQIGFKIELIDLGGGLPESSEIDDSTLTSLVDTMKYAILDKYSVNIALEPGRFIIGDACIFLGKILKLKQIGDTCWIFSDLGINLIPKFGKGTTRYAIANALDKRYDKRVNLCGNLPTEVDILKKKYFLPSSVEKDDILVAFNTGAYTFSLWQRFCFPLPPIVVVKNGNWEVIKEQETVQDYLKSFKK